jgi:hypothetical protein
MGVAEWFFDFCANLVISNRSTISSRYGWITRRLNTDFWDTESDTAHSLQVGSYGRGTAIDGVSDLDMVFQLPYSVYEKYNNYSGNGQSALLQAVRNSIRTTFSTTECGGDGQVVVASFTDGTRFEVLPAFINKDNQSYTFPDSNGGGSWKTCDPRAEMKAINDRDAECNKNLKPLCRMMRAWKDKWMVPMGGLLMDTLAYQFIEDWKYRDKSYLYYDYMCRDFFEFMAGQDKEQKYWRAPGSGQYVYRKGDFEYKAKQCYNLAVKAIGQDSAKYYSSAKQTWREIFGTAFPN